MAGNRRDFLKGAALGALGVNAVAQAQHAGAAAAGHDDEAQVDKRELGRIGEQVSILGLGLGSAFTKPYVPNPDAGHALLRRALELGINYFDTARDYRGSEELIGPVVAENRERIFLVSKTHKRDYDGFMRDLDISLRLLQTDHLDLYHIHQLQPQRDRDLAAIERGAVRAAREAKADGRIRHFGVTGHASARLLRDAVKAWDPDALLTIFPCTRPDQGRYEDELLPVARERNMGVIAMKTVRHARNADLEGTDLIRYAMSLEGVHVTIVGLDTAAHLEANAEMATDFRPMAGRRRAALHREATLALRDLPALWEMPWYEDGTLA